MEPQTLKPQQNDTPEKRPYQFTNKDYDRLKQDGTVPNEVYTAYLNNGKKLLPDHQEIIASDIAFRYRNGNTTLPTSELQNIMSTDVDTLRLVKALTAQPLTPPSEATQPLAPSEPSTRINTVEEGSQPAVVPLPSSPTFEPIGWTVAATERPDQLSDADFRFGQTVEFRFNPVSHETPLNQPGGSSVEALKVAEQLEAAQYELLLPAQAEEIRQFLKNDGYLSNEELSTALYDAGLKKEELHHKVESLDTSNQPGIAEKITNYLWDVHESVMDSPLRDYLDPKSKYELVAILHQAESSAPSLNPAEQPVEKLPNNEHPEDGILSRLLRLKTFEGGMMANMVHNYQLMQELTQKILGVSNQNQPPQQTMEIQTATRYDGNQIKEQMERNGVTRESLEKTGNLENLLNGRRTENLQLSRRDANGTETPVSGRLYIAEVPGKGPIVYLSPERQQLKLPISYHGHVFTKQDQENLLKTGELGRVVTLKDKITQEPYQALVGIDPVNKSLTVMRQERFTPPTKLLGAELSPEQRDALRNHQTVRVHNMIGDDKKPFTADVQINVNKRSFSFKRVYEQEDKLKAGQQPKLVEKNSGKNLKAEADKKIKTPANQKQGKESDTKQAVSVAAKNGQQRITVDKSTSGPTVTPASEAKKPQAGKKESQTIVNGTATQRKSAPKQRRGPKL